MPCACIRDWGRWWCLCAEREREREIAVGQASSIAAASRLVGRPRFVPQEQERCWDDGWIDLIVVASFLIPAHARTRELGATNWWWPELDKIQNHMMMWRLWGSLHFSVVTNWTNIEIMAPSVTGNTRIWDWRVNASCINIGPCRLLVLKILLNVYKSIYILTVTSQWSPTLFCDQIPSY